MALTNFFEVHGTGTRAGDPTKALGIQQAFKDRPRRYPLRIGAVKTNIGHLEGGAGLAGLIKTILALKKGIIPLNAWFEKPNDSIDAAGWNLEVSFASGLSDPVLTAAKFPIVPIPWPTEGLSRDSVSPFGFGNNCINVACAENTVPYQIHVIPTSSWAQIKHHLVW